ncbi:nucleotidyl transferase AbiEii/AbiGii toxin family protein [candidate division WOR-3 bacterium]|nr:nucleotidyl transferase AbiEii/AbiGii toxin family protein [candidate division WOR-3 bacterium]
MDKEILKDIIFYLSSKYKFRPAIIEKDYYLTLILNHIRDYLSDKIIFKGGTLLNKIYFDYKRLSEDLDFSFFNKDELNTRSKRSRAIRPIKEKMPEFLEMLELKSDNPEGEGFNESNQYIFKILYSSVITGKEGITKIEISLRNLPLNKPVYNRISHFYKDPFTGENLMPSNKVLCLSLKEAVAEKLRAAITREYIAIRDFYDLWHISGKGFDFHDKKFIKLFKKKLEEEQYEGDYSKNFGFDKNVIIQLKRQIETDLIPVIPLGEKFDINKVFMRFNKILKTF